MDNQDRIIVVSSGTRLAIDKSTLRYIRGGVWAKIDPRFALMIFLSLVVHGIIIYLAVRVEVKPKEEIVLEKIPERFAKLIIDKPLPKADKKSKDALVNSEKKEGAKTNTPVSGPSSKVQRSEARKNMQEKVQKVENKVRTVGVLGMLSGVGSTAKGPAVVDVLGTMKDKSEKIQGLDEVLANMTGLKKNEPIEVLDRKLVKSKDVAVTHKEQIDDLIADVSEVKTYDLAKKGDFQIQRPESIEGAASNNSKRDPQAINDVVTSHRSSIKMTYEKYLKRDPNLEGKITIRLTIAASGNVISVKVVENTTGNTEFADEIIRKVRMWEFEPVTDGEVTVSYPFVFTPAA